MGRGNINQRLNGLNPLSYMGDNAYQPPEFVTDNRAPTSNDSMNFELGTIWLDTKTIVPPTANNVWILVALRSGVATWVNFSAGIMTLTSNSGGPVSPTAGNINVVGDGTTIVGVGNPGTSTITFSVSGTGVVSTLTGNSGGAVPPTAGNINVVVGASTGTPTIIGTPGTSTLSLTFSNIVTGNLGIGTASLASATVGANDNTAYGGNSLTLVTTGDNNTAIGWNAGSAYTTESSNISIGANVNGTAADQNTLRVGAGTGAGAGQLAKAFISGIDGVNVGNVAKVITMASDQLGTATLTAGTGITITPTANTITISGTSGTVTTLRTDDTNNVTATAGVINLAGAHGLNTTGTVGPNTATVAINNAIVLGDLAVLGADVGALTVTTGDVIITAGDLTLPNTNTAGNQGIIKFGGNRWINNYGSSNTFVGENAGNLTLTTGSSFENTAIGAESMQGLTTGFDNTCVGRRSGRAITTGYYNVLFGHTSGIALTTGTVNTGLGTSSMQALTTGTSNTVFGFETLRNCTTGLNNVAIGSGTGNVTGNGDSAGAEYTGAESNNIVIQNIGVTGESNIIRIGTSGGGAAQQNKCFIAGIRGITTDAADAIAVLISSTGQLGTVSSSLRYKENVKDIGDKSDAIFSLRPVVFNYKDRSPESKSYGLIAEEVEQVMPQLVVYNDEGKPETIKYQDLPILLLNELQKKDLIIDNLLQRVSALESRFN